MSDTGLLRADVYVQEDLYPSFVAGSPPGTIATFIGTSPMGPLAPTIVTSWTMFTSLYGGFKVIGPNGQPLVPSSLALAVYNYFSNGGRQAQILRVTASGTGQATPNIGSAASLTLRDQGATPQTTAVVQAQNPGAWGNQVYIDVVYHAPPAVASPTTSGTFDLIVHVGGVGALFIAERWTGVSMDKSNPMYAPNIINSSFNGSNFIRITDMNSASAPPLNEPQTITGVPLIGGLDGGQPSSLDFENSFSLLDAYPGPMLLNLPGDSTTSDVENLIAYAIARQNQDSFVIVDPPQGDSVAGVVNYNAGLTPSSYAATYYPWIQTADPVSAITGAVRTCSPGAFAAAVYARTDGSRGTWKAPAGLVDGQITTAIGTERPLTNSDLDSLARANVNPIRQVPQQGIHIWGAKTLSNVLPTQFVPVRRALIEIRINLYRLCQFALFEPNDYILWNHITNVLTQYLIGYWQSGGLAGGSVGEAFFVQCDQNNNTTATIQQGEVNVNVGVAPQYPAQFVVITIGLWQGNGNSPAAASSSISQ